MKEGEKKIMVLENKKYKLKEIAEWFNMSANNFSKQKDRCLAELKCYAEFEVKYTPSGRVSYIDVTRVLVPIYEKPVSKQQFLDWLPTGIKKVATWAAETQYVLSWPLLVNYYCKENNIPYDGPHYILEKDEGVSYDSKRKVEGNRKIPNPDFSEWHYLYNLVRRWSAQHNISLEDWSIDCCADSFNPTSLRISTKEDLKKREQIYKKWFGVRQQEVLDLVDYIDEYADCYIPKDELMQLRICQRLSDRAKRIAAAKECAESGVLKRKGYHVAGLDS